MNQRWHVQKPSKEEYQSGVDVHFRELLNQKFCALRFSVVRVGSAPVWCWLRLLRRQISGLHFGVRVSFLFVSVTRIAHVYDFERDPCAAKPKLSNFFILPPGEFCFYLIHLFSLLID